MGYSRNVSVAALSQIAQVAARGMEDCRAREDIGGIASWFNVVRDTLMILETDFPEMFATDDDVNQLADDLIRSAIEQFDKEAEDVPEEPTEDDSGPLSGEPGDGEA